MLAALLGGRKDAKGMPKAIAKDPLSSAATLLDRYGPACERELWIGQNLLRRAHPGAPPLLAVRLDVECLLTHPDTGLPTSRSPLYAGDRHLERFGGRLVRDLDRARSPVEAAFGDKSYKKQWDGSRVAFAAEILERQAERGVYRVWTSERWLVPVGRGHTFDSAATAV